MLNFGVLPYLVKILYVLKGHLRWIVWRMFCLITLWKMRFDLLTEGKIIKKMT